MVQGLEGGTAECNSGEKLSLSNYRKEHKMGGNLRWKVSVWGLSL